MYLSLLKIGRLFHLISKKKYKKLKQVYVIKKSPLFDAKWYLQQYPDVKTYKSGPAAHYLEYGWKEGRNPSERFDSKIYLNENLDVQNGQLNPLYHYEKFGKFEGRSFNECESIDFTDKRKIEKRRNLFQKIWNFFDNIRYTGKSEDYKLISKSKYFDKHWYLKTYPDVKGKDPVEHYLKYGWKEGKNPGPLFDGAIYFDFHKDVAKVGINPLRHYEKHKIDEKRICNVSFPAHRNIFQLIKSTFFYKEPKFSIIVASYNYEKYIKKTLDSILAQTYKNFEIIVIDDGSSDNSVATIKKYVKKYDNIKLYRHKKGINKGLPASLELGISKCNGDYIGFCESDDFWTKDHLEEYVKIIKKYAAPEIITNDCKCFGSTVELVNKKQRYIVDRNRWIFQQKNKKKFSFHEFKENNYITTFSAVMVKATVLKKCNFLTPRKAAIDWWLWRQLAFHHPVYFINKRITMWRIHESYLETSTEEKKLYHQCFIHRMDKILKDKNYLNKISKKDYKIIKNSKHFDENYYRNTYGIKDCIKHYYTYGWRMGYNPSLNFSTNDYLELNPEVIKSDVCPLIHYEVFGRKQWNRYIKEKVINQKVIDQYWKERKCYPNRNIVQYTCMTGGYDNFIISDYFDPKYDYVLFTDNKKLLKEEYFGVWKCQPLKYTGSDNVRISRWHKTHPHELFSKKYKYSLWCDSNQNFLTDYIYKLIEKHIKNGAKIAAFKHYCRDCLYEEAIECKNQRKDNIDIINSQILKYQKDGFPKHYGLFETGLIFREHNNPKVKKIDNDWFSEISKYSRRDQLSFTYALWKNRFCCALFDKKNLREIDSEVELFKHLQKGAVNENIITKINYRSYDDLKKDILKNINRLKIETDLIVAIPRSGVIPAYMIGAFLDKPVKTLDEFIHNIETTKGDRMKGIQENYKNVLVIDDSVNEGVALKRTKSKIGKLNKVYNIKYAAVYGTEISQNMVDFCFAICPQPRVFEWNYLNSCFSKYMGFDIDGVLCVDPTDEENDDGKKYIKFLLNAKPLYIPKYEIGALVTSRLDKYRKETETWCRNNKVKYKELYMLDLPSKEERIKQNAHTKTKIEIYKQRDDLVLFIESSARQAEIIARETLKEVICVENGRLYSYKMEKK